MASVDLMVNLLSTAVGIGNILQGLFTLKKASVDPTPDQYELIERRAEEVGAAMSERVASQIVASSLSEEIVDVLLGEMEKIKKQIKGVYSDPGMSSTEKQRASDFCLRDYCATLHNMKKHLAGKLPEELEKEWRLNLCEQFFFF
jgi:hypothetical protein